MPTHQWHVVAIDIRKAQRITILLVLYVEAMLILGQLIRIALPEYKYGLHFREVSPTAWLLMLVFWIVVMLINCIKFRFEYWSKTWNKVAIGGLLASAGAAGNFIEAHLTRAVTDFIPARILGELWIININDIMIVLGACIFLFAAVIFIYKTIRWVFYYEFKILMQN